jgi:hypothetical protein
MYYKRMTEEELEEVKQACSELPRGRYLYGSASKFTSGCVGEFIVVKTRSRKTDAGWKLYCDNGDGKVWTDCFIRVVGGELLVAFKVHDHVEKFTIELWKQALRVLGLRQRHLNLGNRREE